MDRPDARVPRLNLLASKLASPDSGKRCVSGGQLQVSDGPSYIPTINNTKSVDLAKDLATLCIQYGC